MKDILLFIPCYNEAERLDPDALLAYVSAHPSADLCLVDDGSTDGTEQIIERLEEKSPNISSYRLTNNLGKGGAIRQALLDTPSIRTRYRNVGYFDADLSTPLDFAQTLERQLSEHPQALMAMGSRLDAAGEIDAKLHRRWIGKAVSSMINRIVKYPFHDTQCGAKLFPSSHVEELFEREFISSWLFDIELILRIRDRVAPESVEDYVLEISVPEWHHVDGSKITPGYFPQMIKEMLQINKAYN